MLDLRLPSGWFFTIVGAILLIVATLQPENRAPLTDVNINLYCGLLLVCFGAFLLLLAWNARKRS
jgi:uncharacterized membrane protein HdeD (DUF308 family)